MLFMLGSSCEDDTFHTDESVVEMLVTAKSEGPVTSNISREQLNAGFKRCLCNVCN